jgi:hypothetical protein
MHGHKHHARIKPASSSDPVVIAAASFAATSANLPEQSQNQFYLIDITLSASGGPPKGKIRAWNWFPNSGWIESTSIYDGIYTGCGFGLEHSLKQLASDIASLNIPISWPDAVALLPELQFLTPMDFVVLQRETGKKGLIIETSDEGQITKITRAAR